MGTCGFWRFLFSKLPHSLHFLHFWHTSFGETRANHFLFPTFSGLRLFSFFRLFHVGLIFPMPQFLNPLSSLSLSWVGGMKYWHTHFGTDPPSTSKHQTYIKHVRHLLVYNVNRTCHIRHETSDLVHILWG